MLILLTALRQIRQWRKLEAALYSNFCQYLDVNPVPKFQIHLAERKWRQHWYIFSSSRNCWPVCLSISPSESFVKKEPLEYQMVTKTYLPSYICYRCDGSDISDSSDSNDQKNISPQHLFSQKKMFTKNFFHKNKVFTKKFTTKFLFFFTKRLFSPFFLHQIVTT